MHKEVVNIKHLNLFKNKDYYEGDNDENNRFTDDSHTGNDDFVRNLDKEQENEDDE